jgi:hypothetical protein
VEITSLRHRAAQAQLSLATTQFDYNPNQRRAHDGKWTDGDLVDDPGLKGVPTQSAQEYESTYGDVVDERNVDLGEGRSLTARYFESGDAHAVIDLPGGKTQVIEEMSPESMRALADNIDEMLDFDGPGGDAGGGDIVADIDSSEHDFYVARDGLGDIRLQPGGHASEDWLDMSEGQAAEFSAALREMANDYDEYFEED